MTIVWFINIFLLILLTLYWVEEFTIAILLVLLLYVLSIIGQVYLLVLSRWKKLQEKYKVNISQSVRVFLALIIFAIQIFVPVYGINKLACKAKSITAGARDVFDSTARLTVALGQVTVKHAIKPDLEKIRKIQEVNPDEVIKDVTDEQKQAALDFEKKFFEATVKMLASKKPEDLETRLRLYNTQIENLQSLEVQDILHDKVKKLLNEAKQEYIAHIEGNIERAKQSEDKEDTPKYNVLNFRHLVRSVTHPLIEPALARAKIIRAEKLLGIEEEKAGRYVPIVDTVKIRNHDFLKDFYEEKPCPEKESEEAGKLSK